MQPFIQPNRRDWERLPLVIFLLAILRGRHFIQYKKDLPMFGLKLRTFIKEKQVAIGLMAILLS